MNKKLIIIISVILFTFFVFGGMSKVLAADEETCVSPIPIVKANGGGYTEEEFSIIVMWTVDQKIIDNNKLENFGYKITKVGPKGEAIVGIIDPAENQDVEEKYSGFYYDPLVVPGDTYTYKISLFDINGNEFPPGEVTITAELDQIESVQCDNPSLQGEVVDDPSGKAVKLSWQPYCEIDVEYRIFRDDQLIFTISSDQLTNYSDSDGVIEYTDKTFPQTEEEKEYTYKVEVWGPKLTSKNNFLITKAFATGGEKKAESSVKIKVGKNTPAGGSESIASLMPEAPKNLPNVNIPKLITKILSILFDAAMVLLVLMLLYGGVLWIMSGGDEEQTKKAKNVLKFAIIGAVIACSVWAIAEFVVKLF